MRSVFSSNDGSKNRSDSPKVIHRPPAPQVAESARQFLAAVGLDRARSHHLPKAGVIKTASDAWWNFEQRMQRFSVLSLDGGGCRGLIEIEVLKDIERRTGKKVIIF